ncbi:unnamed protein product [Schistosoma margrebowiei]|uniref:Uncharacterized protein n=1 Tax=Schistosoma margrebowiei TaxID=48269 RepID=A0A183N2Y8_9TREM|nr:unnamed protein product [Schistosoma margrebowiei]
MKTSTSKRKHWIQWTARMQLDDLDFADDVALLSRTQQQMQQEDLEDVKTFTYLSSIIGEHGGSDADVKAQIGKARAAYLQLKNIWSSKQLSTNTKEIELNNNNNNYIIYSLAY